MALQADTKVRLDKCGDDELLRMLDKPEDYLPEAIDYARAKLLQRGKANCIVEEKRLIAEQQRPRKLEPICKVRFPLPSEALPQAASSGSTPQSAPCDMVNASGRASSLDRNMAVALSWCSRVIGLFSLILLVVILMRESWVFKYSDQIPIINRLQLAASDIMNRLMNRLQFAASDNYEAFSEATFFGIILLIVLWGIQIAVVRQRWIKGALYTQWASCALTLFYFLIPLPLKFSSTSSWDTMGGRLSFYRERSAFYAFNDSFVPYLICAIAVISLVYVSFVGVRVLRQRQVAHLVFTSPLPFISVLCFSILAMGFAGNIYSHTQTSMNDRDMFITFSLFGAFVSMLGWFVWHTVLARRKISTDTTVASQAHIERLAIWSLCLGCSGFIFNILAGIPAVVCGHLALSKIKKTGSRGRGLAIAGLVLGYLYSIGFVLCMLQLILHR